MRTARLKGEGCAYYHCISRVIERRMALGRREKERFRAIMRQVEGFSGVRILTSAILDNHIHLLVEVPEPRELGDEEFLARLRALYSGLFVRQIGRDLKQLREQGDERAVEKLKGRYTYRMHDVSEFMKTLKQRFTQWYNRANARRGTLWEERFKSVLLEGGVALSTVAAYIDLNAVRVGLVTDPKDYRYCGYGEAVGGVRAARTGLATVMATLGVKGDWRKVGREYRRHLYMVGDETPAGPASAKATAGRPGVAVKPGFKPEAVRKVLDEGGALSRAELLRCRVRYFADGVALGSREFVEDVYLRNREQFGRKRKDGARTLRGGEWGGLCAMRDLRLRVISVGE